MLCYVFSHTLPPASFKRDKPPPAVTVHLYNTVNKILLLPEFSAVVLSCKNGKERVQQNITFGGRTRNLLDQHKAGSDIWYDSFQRGG